MSTRAAAFLLWICAGAVFPVCLLFGQSAGSSGDASALLASARAVRIQVSQSYVDGEEKLKGISVPAGTVAARVFGYAGVKSVPVSAKGESLAVSISITGEAESADYIPGGRMSTGASIAGTVTLGTGESAFQEDFSGDEPPPTVVTLGAENLLPFEVAFDQSDFASVLLGLLGRAFGSTPLVKALADPAASVRRAAVGELAGSQDRKAAAALIPMLKDKEPSVRTAAAEAVGTLKMDGAVPALLAALKSTSNAGWPEMRASAVRALAAIGNSAATPALVTALTDRSADVRKAAAAGLASMGWQPATDQERIAVAVAKADFAGAAAFGHAAVPRIKALLQDDDSAVQDAAINALAGMDDPTGLDAVIALAMDRSLNDLRPRLSALTALGESKEPRACDALLSLLREPEYSIVYQAATTLAQNGEQKAVTPLLAVLKGKDLTLRQAAAPALQTLGWKPATDQEAVLFYPVVQDWDACASLGDKAIPTLLETARSGGFWNDALDAVGRINTPASVAALVKLLKDVRPELRAAAASALGKAKAVSAVGALKRAQKDEDPSVQDAASQALADMGDNSGQ
jgi:HEAT repeat protein